MFKHNKILKSVRYGVWIFIRLNIYLILSFSYSISNASFLLRPLWPSLLSQFRSNKFGCINSLLTYLIQLSLVVVMTLRILMSQRRLVFLKFNGGPVISLNIFDCLLCRYIGFINVFYSNTLFFQTKSSTQKLR